MSRLPTLSSPGTDAVLAVGLVLAATGCAAGVSTVAAPSARTAALYRSASAHVRLGADEAFGSGLRVLRERRDIDITDLDSTGRRCTAVTGEQTLTFRVIDDGVGGSRVSVTVGRGSGATENQAFAEQVVQEICHALGEPCDHATPQQ